MLCSFYALNVCRTTESLSPILTHTAKQTAVCHSREAYCLFGGIRLFLDRRGRRSLQGFFVGEGFRLPPLCTISVCFREAKPLPYTTSYSSALCILHSTLICSAFCTYYKHKRDPSFGTAPFCCFFIFSYLFASAQTWNSSLSTTLTLPSLKDITVIIGAVSLQWM